MFAIKWQETANDNQKSTKIFALNTVTLGRKNTPVFLWMPPGVDEIRPGIPVTITFNVTRKGFKSLRVFPHTRIPTTPPSFIVVGTETITTKSVVIYQIDADIVIVKHLPNVLARLEQDVETSDLRQSYKDMMNLVENCVENDLLETNQLANVQAKIEKMEKLWELFINASTPKPEARLAEEKYLQVMASTVKTVKEALNV